VTTVSGQLRAVIVERARELCEYCQLSQLFQVATFPVDHIIPLSRGGATELDNLALACPSCNANKWAHIEAVDPESEMVTELFHPRRHLWTDHFRWSPHDPAVLEPITPIGRATAALLELNSTERVAIRRWLIVIRRHPPE
jgi:hypothetical protein